MPLDHTKEPKREKKSNAEKPVSLWGASFREVVEALLKTSKYEREANNDKGLVMRNKILPEFDEIKTTEAAAILLQMSAGKMKYIRLLKLLYLADRKALELWERPITYDNYASMKKGQILSTTYDLIKGTKHSKSGAWEEFLASPVKKYWIELKGKMPRISKLSAAEVKLLRSIYQECLKLDDWELAELTKGPEYTPTKKKSIPTPIEKLLEALNYQEKDIERITSDLEDYAHLQRI